MEVDDLEDISNDTIVADGLDIDDEDEDEEYHASFKRNDRRGR
ncbi:hypothetical protein [Paenibacillus hexagrammi]|nr:hypothetical protein [Paenibacillus sp. YPD9-1]